MEISKTFFLRWEAHHNDWLSFCSEESEIPLWGDNNKIKYGVKRNILRSSELFWISGRCQSNFFYGETKSKHLFFPFSSFSPRDFHCIFFSSFIPHHHYSVFYIFFSTVSSFSVSLWEPNVEGGGGRKYVQEQHRRTWDSNINARCPQNLL